MGTFGGRQPGAGRKKGVDASREIAAALIRKGAKPHALWDKAIRIALDDNAMGQTQMITTLMKKITPDLKAIDARISGSINMISASTADLEAELEKLRHSVGDIGSD